MHRKLWGIGSVLFGIVVLSMASVLTVSAYDPVTEPLVTVDSNQTVGTFTFLQTSADTYEIKIDIDDPWCATTASVSINIPLSPSTAVETVEDLPCETTYRYTNLDLNVGESISASVMVYDTSVNDNTVDVNIGGTATMTPRGGTDAYWEVDVDGSGLSGTYDAWCLNFDHLLLENSYTVDIEEYDGSTASSSFAPDDFDIMWWIINESGQTDRHVVQYALWLLSNKATSSDIRARYENATYPFATNPDLNDDLEDAEDLLQTALVVGEGYDPGCGNGTQSGVALVPQGTEDFNNLPPQELLLIIPLPCPPEQEEARAEIPIETPEPNDWACLKFDPAEQSLYYTETPTFHLEVRNCDTGQDTHGPIQMDRMMCTLPPGVQVDQSTVVGGFFQSYTLDPVTNVLTFSDLQVPNMPAGLLPEGQNFDVFFTASISEAPARSQLSCTVFVDGEPDALALFDLTIRGLNGADPAIEPPVKDDPLVLPEAGDAPPPPTSEENTLPPNSNLDDGQMPDLRGF